MADYGKSELSLRKFIGFQLLNGVPKFDNAYLAIYLQLVIV